ncbi:uncharacterized protein MP3633_1808 [Marinomonas primoryensis]|uniref:Uncharacterized protein n=1 Tax=Marinomonas primoryensis TaxID=178399 RepID=A0A859CVL1_9GAMM|nr:uncharacterized protein MP3633_1808 [Marinomonas primoryensis]
MLIPNGRLLSSCLIILVLQRELIMNIFLTFLSEINAEVFFARL